MREQDFNNLRVGQVIRDVRGVDHRIIETLRGSRGRPRYKVADIHDNEEGLAWVPDLWSLPPQAAQTIKDIAIPTVATSFTSTFAVPKTPNGDTLVMDDNGCRMVIEPDGSDAREGGDAAFSYSLYSTEGLGGEHRFMKSMLGRRIRVTVEVLED